MVRYRDIKKFLGVICISSDIIDTSQGKRRISLPKNFRNLNIIGLGLYMMNGIYRPLTSIRHMTIQVARMRGESLDNIAERFNTLLPVLQKT